jgi:hypothetical protein
MCLRNLSYAYRLGKTYERWQVHALPARGRGHGDGGTGVVGKGRWGQRDVACVWNVMAHAQKPDFVFRRNGRVNLNLQGSSVQSTTGSRGLRISGSNAGYTMFRGSVKSTGYPLHSPISPSLPLPCVTVCHHISTGLYIAERIIFWDVSLRMRLLIPSLRIDERCICLSEYRRGMLLQNGGDTFLSD